MNVTRRLSEMVAETRITDVPELALQRATVAVMDFFACAVVGSLQVTGKTIVGFVRDLGSQGRSTVIASDLELAPPDAALANGTLGHAIDYDDVTFRMIGHPGVTILPAILGLAEATDATTQDVLLAYVVGYETANKLGSILNVGHSDIGWHPTGTLGALGAAAGAAKILGLNVEQAERAFGMAGSMAAGIRQNFGTDTKPFHAGRAAQNGTVAAMLAQRGFTADHDIFEGKWGFFHLFSGPSGCDPTSLLKHLADPWEIVDPGFATKVYPSCASTHTGIDSMLRVVNDHDVQPDEVESIDIGVVHITPKFLIHNDPHTGLEGKFSMQYCLSRALLDRSIRIPHFTDSAVQDPRVRSLMRKVNMYVDPAVNDGWRSDKPRPVILSLTLKDGRKLRQRIDFPTGSAENPVGVDRIEEKYRDCVGMVFDQNRVDETLQMFRLMSKVDIPISELTRMFKPAALQPA